MRKMTFVFWIFTYFVFGFLSFPKISGAVIEGIPCTTEPTDMLINYGNVVTCSIGAIGDTDTYRFSGIAGETVVIQASQQSGDGDIEPCIELFAPDNTRLADCRYSDTLRIDTTLNQTGTYSILVTDYGNNKVGEYEKGQGSHLKS